MLCSSFHTGCTEGILLTSQLQETVLPTHILELGNISFLFCDLMVMAHSQASLLQGYFPTSRYFALTLHFTLTIWHVRRRGILSGNEFLSEYHFTQWHYCQSGCTPSVHEQLILMLTFLCKGPCCSLEGIQTSLPQKAPILAFPCLLYTHLHSYCTN